MFHVPTPLMYRASDIEEPFYEPCGYGSQRHHVTYLPVATLFHFHTDSIVS
jgi:hypothetical protein